MGYVILVLVLAAIGYVLYAGRYVIPAGQVGIVTKKFGARAAGDDELKVSIGGGAGVQARTLRPNTRGWLPPFVYEVACVPQVGVPNGTIGLVVAKVGKIRPPGRPLADHIDCDHFRDGEKFLRAGGQQGRQLQVLTSGRYAINTEMFEIITVDTPEAAEREKVPEAALREVEIPVGATGVVVTRAGTEPDEEEFSVGPVVPGHESFQLPWVFLDNGGLKGVQEETLREGGQYAINPWFAHVVQIPTRELILEWSKDKKPGGNLDAALGQIVLDVQGHTVRLEMKQTVRIPRQAAPLLVCRFGVAGTEPDGRDPVKQFVVKQLASTVDGYFRRVSGGYRIQEFITKYDDVCTELAGEVRQALAHTGVIAVNTNLEEFECDHPELNARRREIALMEEKAKLARARLAELEAELRNEKVQTEIELMRVKVAEENKKLEHVKIKVLVELLGSEFVGFERVLAQLAKAQVPDQQVISGSGGESVDALLQTMPAAQVRGLIWDVFKDWGAAKDGERMLPKTPRPPAVGTRQAAD
ncbi:SPFH domain / Band 7 family protein [Amycolatopsis xylanica]|uniref:SPFH domain / Band 7 family protein n=1 Tax=Amycolatopsis xylanica TaxID=589385 RepID=A0A1H2TIP3_9PSEU|nr:SPFH domain-containing protein [Amycolatopsis xylanica]SDW43718.1 SPFH domain / Band 7 family protein [Amycolatopsis xylanica]